MLQNKTLCAIILIFSYAFRPSEVPIGMIQNILRTEERKKKLSWFRQGTELCCLTSHVKRRRTKMYG